MVRLLLYLTQEENTLLKLNVQKIFQNIANQYEKVLRIVKLKDVKFAQRIKIFALNV